jgi:4'-phosphopantetheinyl transferase
MIHLLWTEQELADVPDSNDWLSSSELARLSNLKVLKRRSDWRLGRWTAKRGIAAWLGLPGTRSSLAAIEIEALASGAPVALVCRKPDPVAISISHSNGRAACVVGPSGSRVGCDVEMVEQRSDAFLRDYFTTEERECVKSCSPEFRQSLITAMWSAKESGLKVFRVGLRMDPLSLNINLDRGTSDWPPEGNWRKLRMSHTHGLELAGCWRHKGIFVQTIVAAE